MKQLKSILRLYQQTAALWAADCAERIFRKKSIPVICDLLFKILRQACFLGFCSMKWLLLSIWDLSLSGLTLRTITENFKAMAGHGKIIKFGKAIHRTVLDFL